MMESDMAALTIYNEEPVTFDTNDEGLDMAVEREKKYKYVEEFESISRSNNCQLTEDMEFARMYNMTAFQYDEMESVHKFDKAFDADVAEQASGYQEVVCPTLEGGCSSSRSLHRRGDNMQGITMGQTAGSSVKNC
jgi:hypothetical protein